MTVVGSEVVDKVRIQKLFSQVVLESAALNPAFMNWTESSIQQAVETYQFQLLQMNDGNIVSFICYQQNADWVELLAVGTLKDFHRKGYVKELLSSLAFKCSGTSKILTLEVHSQNHNAIALYGHCGFKTVRIRKNYYSDGQDALVMDLLPSGSLK